MIPIKTVTDDIQMFRSHTDSYFPRHHSADFKHGHRSRTKLQKTPLPRKKKNPATRSRRILAKSTQKVFLVIKCTDGHQSGHHILGGERGVRAVLHFEDDRRLDHLDRVPLPDGDLNTIAPRLRAEKISRRLCAAVVVDSTSKNHCESSAYSGFVLLHIR